MFSPSKVFCYTVQIVIFDTPLCVQSTDVIERGQLSVSVEEISLFEEGVEQYDDAISPAVPTFVTPASGSLRGT